MNEQFKTESQALGILYSQWWFEIDFFHSSHIGLVIPLVKGDKVDILLQCNVHLCPKLNFIPMEAISNHNINQGWQTYVSTLRGEFLSIWG